MTLYEFLKFRGFEGIDISDTIFDYLNYFECGNEEDTEKGDDYDEVMIWLAKGIEAVKHYPYHTESLECKIADFIEANREVFDTFLNEVYKEEYQPRNNPKIEKETDEFYDFYMVAFSDLINGNFATTDYTILVNILKGQKMMKNLTRQELQEKLNALLLGAPITYNYDIANLVEKQFNEWFDNSQGYYSIRVDNYRFTLCYKRYGFASFNIKRQSHPVSKWAVKECELEEGFEDLESAIRKVKVGILEKTSDEWLFSGKDFTMQEVIELTKMAKRLFPKKNARAISNLINYCNSSYWDYEEISLEQSVAFIKYEVAFIKNDDSEERTKYSSFFTEQEATEYADRNYNWNRKHYKGYRIYKVSGHFDNGVRNIDLEVIIKSAVYDKEEA